ncbi:MAG: DUF4215 domain-containing protein, partial [Byssovorax sp.]
TTCGDGIKAGAEACDDGNTVAGDGCSATCTVQAGYTCAGSPSVCTPICGDGIKTGTEQCDDGNLANGDCCNSACQIEAGCEVEPNGTIATANNFATLSIAKKINGFVSPVGDLDDFLVTIPAGATGTITATTIDNFQGGLCSSSTIDSFITIFNAAGTSLGTNDDVGFPNYCSTLTLSGLAAGNYFVQVKASSFATVKTFAYTLQIDTTLFVCGDGTKSGSEGCDDGNTVNGDGCSSTCVVEAGYTCTGTTPSTCIHTCGNGVLNGTEACDDGNNTNGDGCSGVCAVEAGYTCAGAPSVCSAIVCGNGIVQTGEQCDDGNLVNGDGCTSACKLEAKPETEPNNSCPTANGPYALPAYVGGAVLVNGAANPGNDSDFFAFTTTAYTDLRFETADFAGPGTCGVDTELQVIGPDCVSPVSIVIDQGSIGNCSRVDSVNDPAFKHLPPGTYTARSFPYSTTGTYTYSMAVTILAYCGNGIKEGSEQCDGGATCAADCTLIPVCGDSIISGLETCDDGNTVSGDGCSSTCKVESVCGNSVINGAETCDDGNTVSGDGCSATCQIEVAPAEVEPNNNFAQADARALDAIPTLISGDALLAGAIGITGDKDVFKISVPTAGAVRFETFETAGFTCPTIATKLTLFNPGGLTIYTDTTDGISSCSVIVAYLKVGTYYIQVEKAAAGTIGRYFLQAKFLTSIGAEIEPNGTTATATPAAGGDFFIQGGALAADLDYYAITVAATQSVRAEVIEGTDGIICDSNRLTDSYLTLYNSVGTSLATDDDNGRGYCSLIDGTGATPVNAGAHNLAAGTYYLQVKSTATGGMPGYRLAVSIRNP